MAMVPSQLVASKALMQFLVDKDTGLPLASGTINLYKDDNRLIRKNWYYKTGTPGSYTYTALPNPMTLNGSGAIVDSLGNEVTPYYYPFDEDNSESQELYYITVYNSSGTLQFTQQGFPPLNRAESVGEQATLQNLIVNNQFWNPRLGTGYTQSSDAEVTIDCTNQTNIAICPSNHVGYSMPDIRFIKSTVGANDTIVFKRFANADDAFVTPSNIVPQFYLNVSCSSLVAETYKFIQFPICLNIRNLEQQPFIFTVQTQLGDGGASRPLKVQLLRYAGSGTSVSDGTVIGTLTPTSSWVKGTVTYTFPPFTTGGADPTEDDAYYIQLRLPTNQSYNFNIAVPSLYLGSIAATNDFQSYDKICSITNSPRTGEICQAFGNLKFGWVACNGATIGTHGSGATYASSDTFPLYKLLWDRVNDGFAPVSTGRGGSAYSDFIALKRLTLPISLGDVLIGSNPEFETAVNFTISLTPTVVTFDLGLNEVTFTAIGNLTKGSGVRFTTTGTLPTPLAAGTTYYIGTVTGSTAQLFYNQQTAIDGVLPIDLGGAPAGVHTCVNNNTKLTLATATTLAIGTPIVLSVTGGSLPTGLTALPNAVYYVGTKDLTTTTITLSDTYERAVDSYDLNFFSAGSGTFTINSALGADTGESRHTLSVDELAAHSHLQAPTTYYNQGGSFTVQQPGALDLNGVVQENTETAGLSDSHNTMQRSRLVNVFLKL